MLFLTTGPKGTVILAKGPVVTHPPPVPIGRVTRRRGSEGRLMIRSMGLGRPGVGKPLPDRLYGEPSNSGEASILAASSVQSQYLSGDIYS